MNNFFHVKCLRDILQKGIGKLQSIFLLDRNSSFSEINKNVFTQVRYFKEYNSLDMVSKFSHKNVDSLFIHIVI